MNRYKSISLILITVFAQLAYAQDGYWQQRVSYKINVDFDATKHQYTGTEKLDYTNNSPDELVDAYFHLYLNAFQPGSMMDERSRTIKDADPRVGDRIAALKPDEIGYQKISSVKLDGRAQKFIVQGTILEVSLDKAIKPGQKVTFEVAFSAQVPIQIRRNGRNSSEGVDYSMAQWYPKLSEYDRNGWHPNPYIAREFYGVWGDYDVNITMDSKYVIGATGTLVNAKEIGYGYAPEPLKKASRLKWHFIAENVHDFVWAADTEYKHTTLKAHDGTLLHFFYIPGPKTTENWEKLPAIMDEALKFVNKRYGKYPYPSYAFIQGGDGGMEYPMATLITGERSLASLVGVSVHEWMHSWYQMMLGTNESLYSWMDEGFTSFGSAETSNHLKRLKLIPGKVKDTLFVDEINGFVRFVNSGYEEALTTHSDHFSTNAAFSVGSYTKGMLALVQLQYIVGNATFDKALLKYFDTWKFKHPTPDDFIRIFEKESGMVLDWFKEYWVNTTKSINFSIDDVQNNKIVLKNSGGMPMPIDLLVTTKDGKRHLFYIPQSLMRKDKAPDVDNNAYTVAADWDWTHMSYELTTKIALSDIKSVEIDPSKRMADIDRQDNLWITTNK